MPSFINPPHEYFDKIIRFAPHNFSSPLMQNKTKVYATLKLKKIGFKELAPRLAWNHTEHLEIKTYKSILIEVHFGWVEKGSMENNRRKIGGFFFFFLVGWKFGIQLEMGEFRYFSLEPTKTYPLKLGGKCV